MRDAGFTPVPYDRRYTTNSNFGRIPRLKTMNGSVFGAIGMGEVGRSVARLASAFGMTVLYHQRHRMTAAEEAEHSAQFVRLEELLARSDFISLHLPLNSTTQGIIDRTVLQLVKPGAILVNVARAQLVDREALLDFASIRSPWRLRPRCRLRRAGKAGRTPAKVQQCHPYASYRRGWAGERPARHRRCFREAIACYHFEAKIIRTAGRSRELSRTRPVRGNDKRVEHEKAGAPIAPAAGRSSDWFFRFLEICACGKLSYTSRARHCRLFARWRDRYP